MMPIKNLSNPHNTESFEAESSLLKSIQESQRNILGDIGALAVAESCVRDYPGRFSNYSSRAVVTLATPELFPELISGKRATVPAIQFQATKKGFDGKSKTDTATIKVADYDTEGRLVAVNGFNDKQMATVTGMTQGLIEFREIGILPELNGNLTALNSKQDSMSRHPSNRS